MYTERAQTIGAKNSDILAHVAQGLITILFRSIYPGYTDDQAQPRKYCDIICKLIHPIFQRHVRGRL